MSIFTGVMLLSYILVRLLTKGPCDTFEGMTGFEVEKYKGVWYEINRDKSILFETGDCVTAEYGTDGSYVSVTNT